MLTLKMGKMKFEVYAILRIGDEWELEFDNSTYIVSADTLFERLNIPPSLVPSIQNWFRSFDEPLTDDVLDRWGYANHNSNVRASSVSDNVNIKCVILSPRNNYRFPWVCYYGSHLSRGNFSTFY